MADYYPLISRAVAALEKNNGENRRALYERARGALLAQLRGITPSLSESDITRERLALEESIRKVEAEAARRFMEPSRQPPAPKIRPIEPRTREGAPTSVSQRRAATSAVPPPTSLRPEPRQLPRDAPQVSSRPSVRREVPQEARPQARLPQETRREAEPTAPASSWPAKKPPISEASPPEPGMERVAAGEAQPAPRHPLRRPFAKREPLPTEKAKDPIPGWDAPPRVQSPAPAHESELRTLERPAEEEHAFEAQPPRVRHEFDQPMLEPSFAEQDAEAEAHPNRVPAFQEEEVEESDAPRERWQARLSPGLIRALAAVLIGVAVLGSFAWQWPNLVDLYRSWRAPAVENAREAPAASSRPKIADRIEPGNQATPLTPQTAAAVAQKVVLYEEDPADPNGRRFVGSAIWRTETVTPGPGQAPELAIRADVEVPERKLAMTWSLRRNTDKGLPASHTVEIMFKLPTDFPSGGISNVPGILMKQAEQTRGVPLAGLAVKVTNGFFLIGLSSVDAEKERNVQLLKERAWLDIPVVYNNNRRAILALEKGSPGERVFAEAFKVWKQ
jgi:hypothetical protein